MARPGTFPKGRSGNPGGVPGGRPKIAPEFRKGCRDFSPKAFERLRREVEQDGEYWLRSAELILAYAHGKPTQPVEVDDLSSLTDEQLAARYAALISAGAASATTTGGEE